MTFDMDGFYSQDTIEAWKEIVGEELHYHFGYFHKGEDFETGLRQTVRNFYPHIPFGSRVLDVGCGWGGPATLLAEEHGCRVRGITISQAQVAYCQRMGLDVRRCDIEQDEIVSPDGIRARDESSGAYDVVFMLEVLSHIRDKVGVLTRLRDLAPRLILSVSCIADNVQGPRTVFGGSIELCTPSELKEAVKQAGWQIQSTRNRRFQSIPTIQHWKQNLDRVYGEQTPPGQLGVLQNLTMNAFQSIPRWCQAFPLIDIVAES